MTPDDLHALGSSFDHFHGLAANETFRQMATDMHSADLSFSQMHALFSLYQLGPLSVAGIAQAVGLSAAATSRLVDKLVHAQCVERQEYPEDRRQKLIRLAPGGEARLTALRDVTVKAYVSLLAAVPSELRAQLQTCLDAARRYLPHHPLRDGEP